MVALTGGSKEGRHRIAPEDGTWALRQFLAQENLSLDEGSETYLALRELFRRGLVESKQRTLARIDSGHRAESDTFFQKISAYTAPPRRKVTLGELLDRHQQWLIDVGRSLKTQNTYETPQNLLRNLFGNSKPVDSFTREEIRDVLGILRNLPLNATQRYPGFSFVDSITEAERRGDARKLGAKSLKNYYRNLFAIFSFAVEEGMLGENHKRVGTYVRRSKLRKRRKTGFLSLSINLMNSLMRLSTKDALTMKTDTDERAINARATVDSGCL